MTEPLDPPPGPDPSDPVDPVDPVDPATTADPVGTSGDPAPEPGFDLAAALARVTLPDDDARGAARAALDGLTKPRGSLGRLEDLVVWTAGVQGVAPPRQITDPRVVVFAGDHGVVATAGVSAYPAEVTAQMVVNFLAGGAAINALARVHGARVRVVDMAVDADEETYASIGAALGVAIPDDLRRFKIRRSSGSLDREDALSREEALAAFAAGVAIADEEVDSGADLLIAGDMGIGNTTPAAVLIGLLANSDAASVIGRGTGIDDATWMRKCAAIRDGMRRGRPLKGDHIGLLAAVGGADLAAQVGFLIGAAGRRTPVILDGVVSGAAALVAQRMAHRCVKWWLAGHRSAEPAHTIALTRLDLTPLVEFGMRLGEGTGALVALPVLRSALACAAEMSTLADAGVTDRPAPVPKGQDDIT